MNGGVYKITAKSYTIQDAVVLIYLVWTSLTYNTTLCAKINLNLCFST